MGAGADDLWVAYMDQLAYWAQVYAQLLGSVDQAFGDDQGQVGDDAVGASRVVLPVDPRVGDAAAAVVADADDAAGRHGGAYQNNMLFQMNQE